MVNMIVHLEVTPELAAALERWSDPVSVRIVATPGVGTGWTMEARYVHQAPPPTGHRRRCGNCGKQELPDGGVSCCWNPIGCGCGLEPMPRRLTLGDVTQGDTTGGGNHA